MTRMSGFEAMFSINRLAIALACVVLCANAHGQEPQRLPPVHAPPVGTAATSFVTPAAVWLNTDGTPCEAPVPEFEVGAQFNKGLFIRATDLEKNPFAIYIGGRLQLRHIGFTRDEETWTDNTGTTRDIRNRNQFDAERVRLNISGTAISPDLSYLFIFDADGDGGSLTDGLAFFFTYEFDPAFKVRLGRWKTAANRQWLLSSRYQRLSDRSLATEYFRTGFSDGIWVLGDFEALGTEGWHYEMSLTNGLRSSSRASLNLDDNLGAAATLYCDPLGDYGQGDADFGWHESPVVRFGGSFAYDKSDDRSDAGLTFALGDDSFVRLSDGTRLAALGSLAPGVQLLGDRLMLASFDVGMKYQGWSANVEYFIRSLQDLTASGPLPVNKLYDYGFHAEAGKFLIEKRWDVSGRMSQISGLFGNSFEYSLGTNLYWGDGQTDRVNKLTFDVSHIQRSAVTSSLIDVIAGDTGWLFRTQVQIGF